MGDENPVSLSRYEHQVAELEEQTDEVVVRWERSEVAKKRKEQEEREEGIILHRREELAAAEDQAPFLDSIIKIDWEIQRRHEALKKFYETLPKELQERDSRRYEAEGYQARLRVLSERTRNLKLQLAAAALRKKKKSSVSAQDEQLRQWNRAVIVRETARLKEEMKSRAPKPADIERLNNLKEVSAQNEDLSQPPPTIIPTPNP